MRDMSSTFNYSLFCLAFPLWLIGCAPTGWERPIRAEPPLEGKAIPKVSEDSDRPADNLAAIARANKPTIERIQTIRNEEPSYQKFDAIRNIVNRAKEEIAKGNRNKWMLQRLLKEQDKFPKLLDSCGSFAPHLTSFSGVYKISEEAFITKFTCSGGARFFEFRLFLYTKDKGLHTKALKFQDIRFPKFPNKNPYTVETTEKSLGLLGYDEENQEFVIAEDCTIGYRPKDCMILTKYRVIRNELVLSECLADLENDGRLQYVRIYP